MSAVLPAPTLSSSNYKYALTDDSGRPVSIQLAGDQPKLTLAKNEFALSLAYPLASVANLASDPGTIAYAGVNQKVRAYPTANGFEMEVVLLAPPLTNVFPFTLSGYQDLLLCPQPGPGLDFSPRRNGASWTDTQVLDAKGNIIAVRPDNVPGSIAIYCNKRHGVYKTGKIGHIFRPYATDALNQRVWCDLQYDGLGTLSIVVPQKFLDTAVYPVIVDPTLGYTTAGASGSGSASLGPFAMGPWTMPEAGTASLMWINCFDGATLFTEGIYSDSAGPVNRLAQTAGGAFGGAAGAQWRSRAITLSLTGGTKYWLSYYQSDGTVLVSFDDTTPTISGYLHFASYVDGTMPNPFGTLDFNLQSQMSIYLEYSALEDGSHGLIQPDYSEEPYETTVAS